MTPVGPPRNPYVGPTRSHAKFRAKYKYVNALYYLVVTGKDCLQEKLQTELSKYPEGYYLGMVTHVISNTEFSIVGMHRSDAEDMVRSFDPFIAMHQRQCIISVHRLILDFAIDLLEELMDKDLIDLGDNIAAKISDRRIPPNRLERAWANLGVSVADAHEDDVRLRQLSELRNVIEHNDERATDLYCECFLEHGLAPGETVPVGSREVGYSLAIAEHVAESLDRRAVAKWPDLSET